MVYQFITTFRSCEIGRVLLHWRCMIGLPSTLSNLAKRIDGNWQWNRSIYIFTYDIFTNRYMYIIHKWQYTCFGCQCTWNRLPPAEPNHAISTKCLSIHFPHKKWDPALKPAFGQGSLEAKPWHESPAPGHDTRAQRLARLALSCRWLPLPAEHVVDGSQADIEKHGIRNVVVTGSINRVCGQNISTTQ